MQGLAKQVDNFLRNPRSLDEVPHLTVFHRLLDPTIKDTRLHSARPAQNGKLNQRSLNEEAHALVFAGTDTVGGTLCVGTFYILSNPVVYRRMVEELYAAWPVLSQPPREQDLEQLPYLTAVIKECLRMSNGTVSPAHRVAPKGGVHIDGQYVPGGVSHH